MNKETAIWIDQETSRIIDLYRRKQKKIPTKKEALKQLVIKGWESFNK